MNQARDDHGSIVIDKTLYVLGGWVSGSWSPTVAVMSLADGQWVDGPPLPAAMSWPKVADIAGVVYLLDSYNSEKQLLQLDAGRKTWQKKTSCPYGINVDVSMCSVGEQLCLVGGGNNRTLYLLSALMKLLASNIHQYFRY